MQTKKVEEKTVEADKAENKKVEERVAVAPGIGDYYIPVNILLQKCVGYKTIDPPRPNKKSVEIGAKHSPDTVCTPYKVIMGSFLEGIEKHGVNTIVMPAVGCRLGFYDILQEQVFKDLGHDIKMVQLFDYAPTTRRLFESLQKQNPELTQEKFREVWAYVCRIVIDMDEMHSYIRRNMAFEVKKGGMKKLYKQFLVQARTVDNLEDAIEIGEKYKKLIFETELNKPETFLRIGLVGDIYTLVEPHGNCDIEEWLAKNGVEIVRRVDLTYLAEFLVDYNRLVSLSGGYVNYNIGGSANGTVAHAYAMAKEGIDGIIHMKAATCTPEITAMSILQNISKDFDVPIVYLTFDTETSEAGLHTRLEAFIDMLNMKKEKAEKKESV